MEDVFCPHFVWNVALIPLKFGSEQMLVTVVVREGNLSTTSVYIYDNLEKKTITHIW